MSKPKFERTQAETARRAADPLRHIPGRTHEVAAGNAARAGKPCGDGRLGRPSLGKARRHAIEMPTHPLRGAALSASALAQPFSFCTDAAFSVSGWRSASSAAIRTWLSPGLLSPRVLNYSPPTVNPSTRIVGAATDPRNSKSLAISEILKNNSFRFPATVISSTG